MVKIRHLGRGSKQRLWCLLILGSVFVVTIAYFLGSGRLFNWLIAHTIEHHLPHASNFSWQSSELKSNAIHLKHLRFFVSAPPNPGSLVQVRAQHSVWPLNKRPIEVTDLDVEFDGHRLKVSSLSLPLLRNQIDINPSAVVGGIRMQTADRGTLDGLIGRLLSEPDVLLSLLKQALLPNIRRLQMPDSIQIDHRVGSHLLKFEVAGFDFSAGVRRATLAMVEQPLHLWRALFDEAAPLSDAGLISAHFDIGLTNQDCSFGASARLSDISNLDVLASYVGASKDNGAHTVAQMKAYQSMVGLLSDAPENDRDIIPPWLSAIAQTVTLSGRPCELARPTQMLNQLLAELYPSVVATSVSILEDSLRAQGFGLMNGLSDLSALLELRLAQVYFEPSSVRFSNPTQPVSNELLDWIKARVRPQNSVQLRIAPEASGADLAVWFNAYAEEMNPISVRRALQTLSKQRGQRLIDYFKQQGISVEQLYLALPGVSETFDARPKADIYYFDALD